jgi:hypothetical protein
MGTNRQQLEKLRAAKAAERGGTRRNAAGSPTG